MRNLTQQELKELLHYDPATGVFTWLIVSGNRKNPAGSLRKDGYRSIKIKSVAYKTCRLAFLYVEGITPREVTYINRNYSDDRWENLKEGKNLRLKSDKPKPEITQEYVRSIFTYSPETGLLNYKKSPRYGILPGDLVGHVYKVSDNLSYLETTINSRSYKIHRLIWLYMTGRFPDKGIDHKDGNGLNNKWDNLRECNQSQNQWNKSKYKSKKGLYKGVYKDGNLFKALVTVEGKQINIGWFKTELEAAIAFNEAAKQYYGEFAYLNKL